MPCWAGLIIASLLDWSGTLCACVVLCTFMFVFCLSLVCFSGLERPRKNKQQNKIKEHCFLNFFFFLNFYEAQLKIKQIFQGFYVHIGGDLKILTSIFNRKQYAWSDVLFVTMSARPAVNILSNFSPHCFLLGGIKCCVLRYIQFESFIFFAFLQILPFNVWLFLSLAIFTAVLFMPP